MRKDSPLYAFKETQKLRAQAIRELKTHRPQENRGIWRTIYELDANIRTRSNEYRVNHVAYCLVRGRKLVEIESKVADGHKLNLKEVGAIRMELEVAYSEWKTKIEDEYRAQHPEPQEQVA